MMKFNVSKVFSISFLIVISLVLVFKIQFSYENCNGFAFGDWLVNYQDGGFKRRGLLGTVIFFIYDVFHVKIQYTVFFFQFICNFLFLFYLAKLITLKRHNVIEYVFLFTPFCLWGIFSDCAVGTRKDGILWFLMVFFAYNLASGKFKGIREYFFYLLLFISVFIHESYIFYAPNFVVLHLWHSKKIDYNKNIFLLLSLYIPAVIIFLFGIDNLGGIYTLNILKNSGVELQVGDNIFSWKENKFLKTDFYIENLSGHLLYVLSFTLQVLFAVWYMKIRQFSVKNTKKIFFSFIICLLLAIPLYLIAIDLGRWLYSQFIFLFILIISLLPRFEIKKQNLFCLSSKEMVFVLFVIFSNIIYRVPSYYSGMQLGLPLKWIMRFL
jgi:hypothetical protein